LGTCAYGDFYVNAHLETCKTYYWKVTDKFGNEYTGEAESDGYRLPIDISELPDGLLNKYAGQFLVEVFEDIAREKRVPLLMSRYYDGVTFDVRQTNGNKDGLGVYNTQTFY